MQISTLRRFWGFSVKFSCRRRDVCISSTSSLWGYKVPGGCGARIPLLTVVAPAGVGYIVRFRARGVRSFGLPPACARKRTIYPHMREVK